MTEQQDDTKRYKVIAINLLYPQRDFFLKGTWDGNEQNSPSLDENLNDDVIKGLIKPPLITDDIDHQDEIGIRDYANECRILYMGTKVRSQVTIGNPNKYSNKLVDIINKSNMVDKTGEAIIYVTIEEDLGLRISEINKRTLNKKPSQEEPTKVPSIPLHEVVAIYDQFSVHIDDLSDNIKSLDPYQLSLNKFHELIAQLQIIIPESLKEARNRFQSIIKVETESTEIIASREEAHTIDIGEENDVLNEDENNDEEGREDLDMKPAATVDNIQIDEDQDDVIDDVRNRLPDVVPNQPNYASVRPSSVKDSEEVRTEHIDIPNTGPPLYVRDFGDEIPNYRPTMEPEAMKDLADKIKASPFGQLKGVRILETSIEIILAYATYLIAMVGEATVSNISVGGRSDWFHIKETYRNQYIQAFYASYSNYKNTVHPDTSYRKEYINNGVIAAMTLMISTAIGVSDETFMKAIDENNWKKTVYPFVSGRRKLIPAEKDAGIIIREGEFHQILEGQERIGVIHPSIIDFYEHTFPFKNIKKISPEENIKVIHPLTIDFFDHTYPFKIVKKNPSSVYVGRFNNTREDSDPDSEVPDTDTYFDVERKTKRTKTSTESTEIILSDRKLRTRKSPTIEPPSPSTPQQVNNTYPLPISNKRKNPESTPKKGRKSTTKKSYKGRDQQTPSKKTKLKPMYGKVHPRPMKTNIERTELNKDFLDAIEVEYIDDTVIVKGPENIPTGPRAAFEAICRNAERAAKQKLKATPTKPTKPSKDEQSTSSDDTEYVPDSNDPDTSVEEKDTRIMRNDEQGNIVPVIEEVTQSDLLTEEMMVEFLTNNPSSTTDSQVQANTNNEPNREQEEPVILNPLIKARKRIIVAKSTELDNKTSPSTKVMTTDIIIDDQKDTNPEDDMDEGKQEDV